MIGGVYLIPRFWSKLLCTVILTHGTYLPTASCKPRIETRWLPAGGSLARIYPPLPANQGLKHTISNPVSYAKSIYPPLPANQGLKLRNHFYLDRFFLIYPPLPANQGLKHGAGIDLPCPRADLPTASCKPRIETPRTYITRSAMLHLPTASCKPRIETYFMQRGSPMPPYLPTASCKPRIETLIPY